MAIFHMTVKIHGRSQGQSAVSCAAYRSGSKLYDEQLGRTYDYTRKKGVIHTEILLCRNAPEEYMDREKLWNSVMAVEKASNAQFAREFEIALPVECDRETQIRMLHDFFTPLVEEGMCIDLAIHDKGDGNPHCHALATMRPFQEDGSWGLKEKKGYLLDEHGEHIPLIDPVTGEQKTDGRNRKQWKRGMVETTGWNRRDRVEGWRKDWEVCCNRYLKQEQQVDHRSFERQGITKVPTIHEGYQARAMEKAGNASERCQQNRVIRKLNALLLWAEKKIKELKNHFLILRKEVEKAAHEREGNRQSIYRNAEPAAGPSGSFERGAADPRTGYEVHGRNDDSSGEHRAEEQRTGTADQPAVGTDQTIAGIERDIEQRKRFFDEAKRGIALIREKLKEANDLYERFERIKRRGNAAENGTDGRGNGQERENDLFPAGGQGGTSCRGRAAEETDLAIDRLRRSFEQREQRRRREEAERNRITAEADDRRETERTGEAAKTTQREGRRDVDAQEEYSHRRGRTR